MLKGERYQGKRYRSFLLVCALLTGGMVFCALQNAVTLYGVFAGAISGAFTFYLGGQTATDWKNGKTP